MFIERSVTSSILYRARYHQQRARAILNTLNFSFAVYFFWRKLEGPLFVDLFHHFHLKKKSKPFLSTCLCRRWLREGALFSPLLVRVCWFFWCFFFGKGTQLNWWGSVSTHSPRWWGERKNSAKKNANQNSNAKTHEIAARTNEIYFARESAHTRNSQSWNFSILNLRRDFLASRFLYFTFVFGKRISDGFFCAISEVWAFFAHTENNPEHIEPQQHTWGSSAHWMDSSGGRARRRKIFFLCNKPIFAFTQKLLPSSLSLSLS